MIAGTSLNGTHLRRNNIFYLECVTFQVEDQLFKVPRLRFAKDSEIFKAMFSLPQSGDSEAGYGDAEGSTDENPIKLEGVCCLDFERFLEVLYPLETPTRVERSLQEWSSILRLATMWSFPGIRTFAMENMKSKVSTMNPVNKVLLARECHIESWLLEGYDDLVRRKAMITDEEASRLGWQVAFHLSQERERCREAGHRSLTIFPLNAQPVFGQPSMGPNASRSRPEDTSVINRSDCSHTVSLRRVFASELYTTVREDQTESASPERSPSTSL